MPRPRHRRRSASFIDSGDGRRREWGTVGVSENIIEASWRALVDSLAYAFQPRGDDAPGE